MRSVASRLHCYIHTSASMSMYRSSEQLPASSCRLTVYICIRVGACIRVGSFEVLKNIPQQRLIYARVHIRMSQVCSPQSRDLESSSAGALTVKGHLLFVFQTVSFLQIVYICSREPKVVPVSDQFQSTVSVTIENSGTSEASIEFMLLINQYRVRQTKRARVNLKSDTDIHIWHTFERDGRTKSTAWLLSIGETRGLRELVSAEAHRRSQFQTWRRDE